MGSDLGFLVAGEMNGKEEGLHFVLVPLFAQGHMIPMVDIARMLAGRGVLVTFITTPVNAARLSTAVEGFKRSGFPVDFVELPFPSEEFGLPAGCENLDQVPEKDLFMNFFHAAASLRTPLELCLCYRPRADCMIADMCSPWASQVASVLDIPHIIFHGPSCFYILSVHNAFVAGIYDRVTSESEPFLVPGMPHPVELTRAHAPGWFNSPTSIHIRDEILLGEATAVGVVLNSFYDLEQPYIDTYRRVMEKKQVWAIGPICLHSQEELRGGRGNKAAVDAGSILSWLDSMDDHSVLYASFGSLTRKRAAQITEIGEGLDRSGHRFIWVIKEAERWPEVEEWLVGFEDRTRERGLVIKGWSPQMVVLNHPAVGGFLTHCGWNSTLEAVSAGVPMITWPHFADQFLNERLVVERLRIGVSLGVKQALFIHDQDEELVIRGDLEAAVREVMAGKEAGERRARAAGMAKKAKEGMKEGGSSHNSLTHLIQHITFPSHKITKYDSM